MELIDYYFVRYKRVLCIALIIIILGILLLLNKNKIYREYKVNELSNEVINVLNGKFDNKISQRTTNHYYELDMDIEDLNRYDITKLVDAYIEMMEESIKIYIDRKNGIEKDDGGSVVVIDNKKDFEYGKDIKMSYHSMLKYGLSYDITDVDVDNYNQGIFRVKLIDGLKKCLDFEVINNNIKWEINSIEDGIIKLPYNAYIDYKAYTQRKSREFKKPLRVLNKKEFDLDRFIRLGADFKVEYETINGDIKNELVGIREKDGKYIISLWILTNGGRQKAEAELKSYTWDRMGEEAEKKFIDEYYNDPNSLFNKPFDLDEQIRKYKEQQIDKDKSR